MSGGTLNLGGVHGSVYGPLEIETLSFQTNDSRFEVKGLEFDWAPFALLGWQIQVRKLKVQELRWIALKPSAEPLKLPNTLHISQSLSVPSITVQRLVIRRGASEQVLNGIELGLDKPTDRYKLDLRSLNSPWGTARANLVLGDTPPFNVQAKLHLLQAQGVAYATDADVSGNLSQVLLKAKAQALGGEAEISASLTPFEKIPFLEARIEAKDMNPALLGKGLPKASLGASISLLPQDADGLKGKILLRNELPGPWDQSRLPLRELAAQFSGPLAQLNLSAIQLDLAGAGRFEGTGQIKPQNGQLALDLKSTNFNPHGLHGKMRPMQLAGAIHLQAEPKSQNLIADLRDSRFRFHLDAHQENALLEIQEVSAQAGAGKLKLHGTLALEGSKKFQLAGALEGFNPADFGDYPAANINASLSGSGHLSIEPQAALSFAIAGSQFRHHPLSGQGSLSVSETRIWDTDLTLGLADNRLEASGALGEPGDHLNFRLKADNLAVVDPELHGKGQATGSLEGRFSAPSGRFEAQFKGLSWGKDYRLASLSATGRLDSGAEGPLTLDASLKGLATPRLHLELATLSAQGTRNRHTLKLLAKSELLDLESRLEGGWKDGAGWAGSVMDLANRGRHRLALKSPAKLEIASRHFLLGETRLDFVGADLVLHKLAWDAGQFESRGEIKGLPLAYLEGLAEEDTDIKTDLTLAGDWQFTAQKNVNGHISLRRERGDVAVSRSPRTALGLNALSLKLEVVNNRLQGRAEANGTRLGSLKAEGTSLLSLRDGVWGIAGNAPLQGSADISLKSLAWLQPLLGEALILDGDVRAQFSAGGSFGEPKLTGQVSGERFTLALPEQGLNLTEGRFQAELEGQTLTLKSLALRGGQGKLEGQGRLALEAGAPTMHLSLKADQLEVLSRPDRLVILSGKGETSVIGKQVRLTAQLKADRGLIELSKGDAPTLGDDVVVLGSSTGAAKKRLPYAVNFDLDMDLGEAFFIKGKGLDAQLGGALKLTSVAGALPSSRGSLRVIKGGYLAYGQRLEIERGIVNFQGAVVPFVCTGTGAR
jgi:translocation and assembly module TamB